MILYVFKIKVVFTPSSYNVSASCIITYNQTVCPFQYIERIVLVQQYNNKVLVDINKRATATDKVKTNKKETLFNMSFPHIIPTSELENIHPSIRKLFSAREVPNCPSGKIKALCGDMEDTDKGFGNFRTCGKIQNTFQKEPSPTKNSRNSSPPHINLDQRYQVQVEIDNIWRREPYAKPSHLKEEFLSNVFLVGKKGG